MKMENLNIEGIHLIKTGILFLACCQVIPDLARNYMRLCLIIEIEAKCHFFVEVNIVSFAKISESNIHQNIWRHSVGHYQLRTFHTSTTSIPLVHVEIVMIYALHKIITLIWL